MYSLLTVESLRHRAGAAARACARPHAAARLRPEWAD